jgi:hypothetical protein
MTGTLRILFGGHADRDGMAARRQLLDHRGHLPLTSGSAGN